MRMTKMDLRNINVLLNGLLKIFMREAVDAAWSKSEEELIKDFKTVLTTPDDENAPPLFTLMLVAGLTGNVLTSKYGKDENELMKMLKNSDALFVKEIKEKANETSMGGNRKE